MLKEIVDLKSWVNSGDVSCSDLNTKTTVCKAVSLHILEGPFQHEDLQDLLLILQDIGRAGVAFTEFIISEEFLQMEAVQYLKQECKTEKSDEMYVLMEQFFDAINILSESSAEVKASLVQKFCQLYLDSLLQNEAADFRHRLEILRSMNVLLEDAPCSIKEALLSSQFIKPSLKKLSTLLNEIGDYEFQVCISECLFRIIPKKVRDQTISTVFKNQARRKDFLAIRDNEFETDCRIFLNKLNASLKKSNRVFSVPCNKAWLGDKELHKPDDPNYETFWVDFNAGSERLTVFCGSYNSSEMSSEDMWETLTVWKDDVHSFNVKKIKEVKVVNILFSKMVSDIYPSQQDVSGRSVRLQFDADCHVENALESTFGLEGITQKVSSASTPLVINKDESSQELQDEEIPCTPVSSVYRRKVSVPDVSMPILLSPTGSISSKISEPVSAIRINFSKTPSAYTSKSKAEKVFQTPTVPANKPKQRVKTPVVTVTPPSKSKKKTSTVQTAEVVGKRMNVGLKYDKTLASNNRKASLPELPIQSSNVDVESIPDSCPVEDGKSVSLETSQDVDARIGMSVQSVEEKDKEKYPLSSNEVVEIHTAHDEETSLNSDEHINKQNTKKETQKELKQGFNLSVSKPEKTEKSKPPKTSNSKEEYCNLLSQEYDTIYQVMNNEELHINDTDDFQVLESFHEAQKSNTKSNTKISVLQKEESRKIITNKDKEKILKLEQSEKKLSNIETNISIGQDKKSKINGKCRAAENQTKLEMTDNNYDTKNGKPIITKNAVTKENGYNLVSPNPVIINIDIDDAERNFDFNDDIQVQESFPEPNKKSTKNNGKCQKKQKKSNEYKLLKDKHEQRDESDCDFYSNSGKENIDVNVIENVTSKTKGTKKGGKEPKTSSKLNKKARKVESKDGLSEAFEHATNSFVSVDLEDCLEKKNNKHFEERIGSKIGEKASSNKKRIKSLLEKDPDLNKDLETSSSKLRHNESRDNLTCFTSKDNSFTAEQLHSSWNEELPFSAPDIKKQAKYNKEETFNLQEMEEFDDDNMVCIEINDSTTVVKNNTLLNKFEEYDDYELVIEDDNKFPKQVEFVMPEKYKVVCNSNKKCKQIEKVESPDFEFSDQDDAVPCLVNKIEQDKPKLTSVDKTVKEPKGNKNRKKSGKDSHDSSDIGTKDTIKREQSKQKKKGIQKEKLNRKKSIDPEIIVEDEESDNDLQANSSYKFTCRKLPKCTVFEDSGINVDDETLEVTIPDSLTVGLPSNNEVEAKNVGEKGKAKKRAKGKPINIKECDFNICERQELNVEISDDDERHKSKITPSVSKLYVAEKLHEDVEKDDSPVPSHILIENTNEVTKVRDTVNNRKVPISGKVRTDRMSKIGKYALRKRNKEKLKEAFKVSDTEDEILSTQSSNIDRVNEQLQLTPDNITSYTPDDITSYTPNNKDQSTTFEILENKDKTVSLSDKPKQYGLNKRKSDCAITQNRKFFHSNSLSQTKNSGHYTTTTVQKIDSSSCFGFESPRDDHRTDKSQNSKRSLLLLMSYSQSDTLLPCEKGDAGSDPYDFEAECNRQKGFKTSKVLQKKGSAKSKQQPVMSKTKVKDDIVKKTKKKIANLYEHEALTTMTLFNDASMINKKTKKERDNNKSSLVYNEEGLSPDFPLFNNEIDTYQMKATKAPKKRSKGHNNKQKLYKEKKDSKICKLNNSVSFKDECDDKKQRKMQKEVEFYPGDIEETIDSDQLDPTNLQSVVFDEVSLKKISKRLSNMTSDDKSKATKELDNENSSDSQEVRIGNILNQSKLKSNCTSMPIDIDIGVEPAGSLDSQSPVHIQLKDSCRKKKKESRKKKVEVCSDEEIDNAVLTSGPTKETNSILENFSSICKKIVESNKDQVEEEEDNCYNSKEDEVLKKSNLATKIGRETPYVLTRKSQKTPTTPGNIRKLYRSLDISVMQTPKTPASVYSDMDQIPLNLSGIFSSQKSFLLDSGDEKEEELKINKEVNKKGHTKKKDKKNEIEKHEVTYSPSSAISKILSRSLASFDLDEKEALDTADENPTLSLEDSREFQTEEINRNKKKILKSGGLISGPSTTIRPSKSSLKRKYSAIMTSDLESSQDDDDLDKAYIPRKLFREQKYMVEEQMYSSDMVSDRSSEILSDVDPTTEVSTLLKAFGIDVQRHIGEKRHQLDSLTKSVLKSTQKQMNTVWTMQQRKRSSILNKYQGNMMKELVALEKDVAVLKEAEDNALTLFKQQMKHLHQFRTEQEKRLSNLCEAQQDLEEEMKEVENQSTHQHVMVKSKLREDLSSLQKKLLLESQKEELYHMKRNLQTIFC